MNLPRKIRCLSLVCLFCISLVLVSCGAADEPDDNQFAQQEQSLESEDEYDDDLDDLADTSEEMNPEEDIVAIACPAGPTDGFLIVLHHWIWSLNMNQQESQILGKIADENNYSAADDGYRCPLTIEGSRVYMGQCMVPITNEGFINTSNGVPCDVKTKGTALVSIENAVCKDGVVSMEIIEVPDIEHALDGEKVCPGFTEPWSAYFPISVTNVSFQIQTPGSHYLKSVAKDETGHFSYDKMWILEVNTIMTD